MFIVGFFAGASLVVALPLEKIAAAKGWFHTQWQKVTKKG